MARTIASQRLTRRRQQRAGAGGHAHNASASASESDSSEAEGNSSATDDNDAAYQPSDDDDGEKSLREEEDVHLEGAQLVEVDDEEDGVQVEVDEEDEEEEEEEEEEEDLEEGGGTQFVDLSAACTLLPDHNARPMYVLPTMRVLLEATHPLRKAAYDFLVFVAEPVRRPEFLHEYRLTRASVASAMALFGLEATAIIDVLRKLSKVKLDSSVVRFVQSCERHAGRAKVVLDDIGYRVESSDKALLHRLLEDQEISESRMRNDGADGMVPDDEPLLEFDAPVDTSGTILRQRLESAAEAVEKRRQAAEAAAVAARAALEGGSGAASAAVAKQAEELQREAARLEHEATQVLEDEEDVAASAAAAAAARGAAPPTTVEAAAAAAARAAPEQTTTTTTTTKLNVGGKMFSFRLLPQRVETVRRRCLPTSPGSLQCPLYEEYDYRKGTNASSSRRTPSLYAGLKPLAALRPYQQKSLHRMFYQSRARSGIIVLPCGAGKSLTGVAAAMKVGQATLVLCTSNESAEQWRLEFLHWSTLSEGQVLKYNAAGRREFARGIAAAALTSGSASASAAVAGATSAGSTQPPALQNNASDACAIASNAGGGNGAAAAAAVAAGKGLVLVATYHMIASAAKKASEAARCAAAATAATPTIATTTAFDRGLSAEDVANAIPQHWRGRVQQSDSAPGVTPLDELVAATRWGLVILDEVHVVPANLFRTVLHHVKGHAKLGLTATLIREDAKIEDLMYLIGPKLYEADWVQLKNEGFLANVQCCEVRCDMSKEFYGEYLLASNREAPMLRGMLAAMNPYKFQTCQFLVQYHEQVTHDKILVYGDSLFVLREYAKRLRRPLICGSTSHAERQRILHAFRTSPEVNTIILSRVGDTSIDLPEANVMIQITGHGGSRRQEAQRLGRILRPKKNPGAVPAGEEGETGPRTFNAYFYTLVSRDTDEVLDAQKRRRYLVDNGYEYKVVANLMQLPGAASAQLDFQRKEERVNLLYRIFNETRVRATPTPSGGDKKRKAKKTTQQAADAASAPTPSAPAPEVVEVVDDDDDDEDVDGHEEDMEVLREMEEEQEEQMRPSKFARARAKTLEELTGAAGATYFEYDTNK